MIPHNRRILLLAGRLERALASFPLLENREGTPGNPAGLDIPRVVGCTAGPALARFEVELPAGVPWRRVANLAADIARELLVESVRVVPGIPGKAAIGIEVPLVRSEVVALGGLLDAPAATASRGNVPLGVRLDGTPLWANLASLPHLLIAGETGSGKSVCLKAILSALLVKNTPQEMGLVVIDPKQTDLAPAAGLLHLAAPAAFDLADVPGLLRRAVAEMARRFAEFRRAGVAGIHEYHKAGGRMARIVVAVDELADVAADKGSLGSLISLAQKGRAAGIHLLLATQRPSVDVVPGILKANMPARICFRVPSGVDSRVALDVYGAEKLLGAGDGLFRSPESGTPVRFQGAYVSDAEFRDLCGRWKGAAVAPPPAPCRPPAVRSDADIDAETDNFTALMELDIL